MNIQKTNTTTEPTNAKYWKVGDVMLLYVHGKCCLGGIHRFFYLEHFTLECRDCKN